MDHLIKSRVAAAWAGVFVCATAGAFVVGPAAAQAPAVSAVHDSGFYVGAGVNANLVVPTNQSMYAQGISQVFQGGVLAANGAAFGPTNVDMPLASSISPSAQLGYFQRLPESRWLLGGKLTYNYIGATATKNFTLVPQSGSYTQTNDVTTPFTGNVTIRSYQVKADHQVALMPHVGYTFDRSYVYLGAGPSLTRTEARLNNTVGFANILGVTSSITGTPTTYSNSQWRIGATLAAGATYFLTPSWFIDIGYAFTITDLWNATYASAFANTTPTFSTAGVLSGSYTGGVNTHSLMVSINRRF